MKSTFKTLNYSLIALTLLCVSGIGMFFKLSILNIVLLTLASPVFLWFVLLVLKPVYTYFLRKKRLQDQVFQNAIKTALRQGKKPFKIGNKKHVIYASNITQANKIYHKKIVPLLKANPNSKKRYEYINEAVNNLD